MNKNGGIIDNEEHETDKVGLMTMVFVALVLSAA